MDLTKHRLVIISHTSIWIFAISLMSPITGQITGVPGPSDFEDICYDLFSEDVCHQLNDDSCKDQFSPWICDSLSQVKNGQIKNLCESFFSKSFCWQEMEFGDNEPQNGASFGRAIAIHENIALIGAPAERIGDNPNQGAVYVYRLQGSEWHYDSKLVSSDGAAGDLFGYQVALDGDTAVISAYNSMIDGTLLQGAVYVFEDDGGTWLQKAKLTAPDGQHNDRFGETAIAIDGDTLIVGVRLADIDGKQNQGAAYVFVSHQSEWQFEEKLIAKDGQSGDAFGKSVALHGNFALIGSVKTIDGNQGQGAAYFFGRTGNTWTEVGMLTASDGIPRESFGSSVALGDEFALVGASGANVDGNDNQGAVYVYGKEGDFWVGEQKLTASDGTTYDFFNRIALDGNRVAIGATGANIEGNPNQGAVYIFEFNGETWEEQSKISGSSGGPHDHFGLALDMDDFLLVGAPFAERDDNKWQGAAYSFKHLLDFI